MSSFKLKDKAPISTPCKPCKGARMARSLLSCFNKKRKLNVSFDELISISTGRKKQRGIKGEDIVTELRNKINCLKQVALFKEQQYAECIEALRVFEKFFKAFFRKQSHFDVDTFLKLKGDFEKIQMSFDNNVVNHAEPFEWEIFQSSTSNFYDYLQNSLNSIEEINMKAVTEEIMVKSHSIDVEEEVLLWKEMQANQLKGRKQLIRLNELSSKKGFLRRKRGVISDTTDELFKKPFKCAYLLKENGKVSHLEFDKEDIGVATRRSLWVKVTMHFSKEEQANAMNDIIDQLTSAVFKQYMMLFKEVEGDNRMKMLIYGKVCSKAAMNTTLNAILKDKLTEDAIVKISFETNGRQSLLQEGLNKAEQSKEYTITTNLSTEALSKV